MCNCVMRMNRLRKRLILSILDKTSSFGEHAKGSKINIISDEDCSYCNNNGQLIDIKFVRFTHNSTDVHRNVLESIAEMKLLQSQANLAWDTSDYHI